MGFKNLRPLKDSYLQGEKTHKKCLLQSIDREKKSVESLEGLCLFLHEFL